ncbi:hypothetical protein CC2G_007610 [Coprinopsis cinerea AmutBmut pab1-1]|nr:hypothetical protein CC2G_007610 [Coprinopsis cinerea AmutBmut pab1-1]
MGRSTRPLTYWKTVVNSAPSGYPAGSLGGPPIEHYAYDNAGAMPSLLIQFTPSYAPHDDESQLIQAGIEDFELSRINTSIARVLKNLDTTKVVAADAQSAAFFGCVDELPSVETLSLTTEHAARHFFKLLLDNKEDPSLLLTYPKLTRLEFRGVFFPRRRRTLFKDFLVHKQALGKPIESLHFSTCPGAERGDKFVKKLKNIVPDIGVDKRWDPHYYFGDWSLANDYKEGPTRCPSKADESGTFNPLDEEGYVVKNCVFAGDVSRDGS